MPPVPPRRRIPRDGLPDESPTARCGEPSSPELLHAVEQFNHREYFECHETLEALWMVEPYAIRNLYKGILQVGVSCYHLLRHNYRGATIKLQSGADYLEPFAPRCMGIEVGRLIADARRLRAALVQLGPEHFLEVDQALIPAVHLSARNGT